MSTNAPVATSATPTSESADASAGSSPATSSAAQKPQTNRQRMMERASLIQKSTTTKGSPNTASPVVTDVRKGVLPAASSPGQTDASNPATVGDDGQRSDDSEASVKADDGKKTEKPREDVIPMAAFKERVGKLQRRIEQAEESASKASLEATRYKTALELINSDNERLRSMLQNGQGYDPTAEELHATKFEMKARDLGSKIEREHQETIEKRRADAEKSAQVESIKERLSNEVNNVVAKYPLADSDGVLAALRQAHLEGKRMTAHEAARMIHDRENIRLAKLGYKPVAASPNASNDVDDEAPIVPRTVQRPGTSSAPGTRTGNDRKAMLQWVKSQP